jgi:hypothetical protein
VSEGHLEKVHLRRCDWKQLLEKIAFGTLCGFTYGNSMGWRELGEDHDSLKRLVLSTTSFTVRRN